MSPHTSSMSAVRLLGASFAIGLTAFCSTGFASESGCSNTTEPGAGHSNQASQVVSVDPDTGELVKGKAPASYKPVQADTSPVVQRELSDGTVIADVGDRFKAHLIAEMVDGKLVTCHRMVGNHADPVEIKEAQDE